MSSISLVNATSPGPYKKSKIIILPFMPFLRLAILSPKMLSILWIRLLINHEMIKYPKVNKILKLCKKTHNHSLKNLDI